MHPKSEPDINLEHEIEVDSIEVNSTARSCAGSPKSTYNTNVPRYNFNEEKKKREKGKTAPEKNPRKSSKLEFAG